MKFNSVCCAIMINDCIYVSMCFSIIECNSQTRSCREKRPLAPRPPPFPLLPRCANHISSSNRSSLSSPLESSSSYTFNLSDPNATLLLHHHCSSHSVHPSLFLCLHHQSSLTHKHTYNTPIFANLASKQSSTICNSIPHVNFR